MSREPTPRIRLQVIHVAALWSIAVVQPIFDILGENPEFFVAHDARPRDLVVFVFLVCGLAPLAGFLALWTASRFGPRVRACATWSVIATLLAVIALPIVARTWTWDVRVIFSVAAATGGLLAFAYLRLSPIRLFTTFLAPAIIVVPGLFLFQPGVAGLLRAADVPPLDVEFSTTPPVVMVVFDQLPLPSLLGADGLIDATIYPHFASLSRDASWFPNASAVAGLTQLAVPALLTGVRPVLDLLPVVDDHPANLFTLLGSTYRLVATEPITKLCPDSLCERDRRSVLHWFWSVLPDVSVVYLHIVLPDDLSARLPPVTQNWKNFVSNDNWQGRWADRRDGDRQQTVDEFVDSMTPASDTDPPTLYFLHVLFPHEPWVHLPTGQRYTTGGQIPGLSRDGRWADDEMAVVRSYQRHLLQVRFADTLLGQILDRLRQVGLYDEALVVVTADHGASFQPELLFRRPRRSSFAEIASVPLFIKEPGQRTGRVVRTNVETIDVVPTVAGVLGASRLPWPADGVDVLASGGSSRADKTMIFADGRGQATGPANLEPEVAQVVAQKFTRFDTPNGFDQPKLGLYDEMVGRPVSEFEVGSSSQVEAVVDFPSIFEDADPDGTFVPIHVTGAVLDLDVGTAPPILAVTFNGVVAGITRPYGFPVAGRRNAWEVIVDPRLVVPGANDVAVYAIREDDEGVVTLEPAYRPRDVTPNANLILEQASSMGVTASGFFGIEWVGQQPFRWTRGTMTLGVPINQDTPPAQLFIEVLMTGTAPKSLVVTVNDCTVFDDEIFGRWQRTFPLLGCQLGRDVVEIELRSEVHVPGSRDARRLGVAVGRIELR